MNRVLIFLLLLSGSVFSQQKPKKSFEIVTGRVLSQADSMLVKEFFYNGLKEKTSENVDDAKEFFLKIIEIDPANDATLYELASLYHNENQDNVAEKYTRQAVTVNPGNEWYWLLLADIYKKSKNWPSLTEVFDELIKISPEKEDYYYDKANTLFLDDKLNLSQSLYNDIEKRFGSSKSLSIAKQRIYLKQGKSDKIIEELEKEIQQNSPDIQKYLLLSDFYLQATAEQKALVVLEKAKLIEPANPLVRLYLADIYTFNGQLQEAFAELKTAFENADLSVDIKIKTILPYFSKFADETIRAQTEELAALLVKVHPDEAKAYAVYGDVLFQQQKLKEAKTNYKKALELNNQVYLIWEQLLRIEMSLSEPQAVVADGEEALSVFPNQANLYFLTALGYLQTQNPDKAISYLKNAASIEAEDKDLLTQIYSSLGDAFHSAGKDQESDQAYEKALEISADNVYALNNYAYYLSLRGDKIEKAERMSKKSNELDPDNSSFQDTYAWILFKQKKFKEAKVWMEKSISNDKNSSPTKAEHYGDILFHLNQKDLAIEQWNKAKSLGSQSKQLERKINEKKYVE